MALRFRRMRLERGKPRRLLSVRPLPTMITLGNLLCGFAAIFCSLRAYAPAQAGWKSLEYLNCAGILLFVAMIFDVLDGRVARLTKTTSRFGVEMDSLSDVISFGLAPAVIVRALLDQLDKLGATGVGGYYPIADRYVWLLLAVYVCCAALRLARYNVETSATHQNFFFGLPSPAAAGCVASLVVLLTSIPAGGEGLSNFLDELRKSPLLVKWIVLGLPFLMMLLGLLMVSRIRYAHLGDRLLGGKRSFMHLMICLLGIVLVIMQHEIMLALAFNGYALSGIVRWFRTRPSTVKPQEGGEAFEGASSWPNPNPNPDPASGPAVPQKTAS